MASGSPAPPVIVRRAHPDESVVCADIHVAARAGMTYLPALYTVEETRNWMRDRVFAEERVWVAEVAGRVVGFAALDDGLLSTLYVLPEHQGRGIGTALLTTVGRHAANGLELWLFEQNVGARRFYERHGFETVRTTDGDNEEGLPDRLMRRRPPAM